jgi:hypothetical protein
MEFLLVHFPGSSRRVKIDGDFNGRTEELIQIEAGTHTISLGPPPNFTPKQQTVLIEDTSALQPFEVTFKRV